MIQLLYNRKTIKNFKAANSFILDVAVVIDTPLYYIHATVLHTYFMILEDREGMKMWTCKV